MFHIVACRRAEQGLPVAYNRKNPMMLNRRQFLNRASAILTASVIPTVAAAEHYPSRPVRILVGFAPGGSNDTYARLVAQCLSERLGQPFVVENRPGGGTNIATEAVVRAVPDGHTLLLVNPANAINATLYERLAFNFIREVTPVVSMVRQPLIMLVNPSLPAKTIPEFVSYAKANPGRITMASAGAGTAPHLAGEMFRMMAGIDLIHVPYRAAPPALTDLLGGQVQLYFAGMASAIDHVKSGKLRALGITTAKRSDSLPQVVPIGDFLAGYEASDWFGLGVPKGTRAEIVNSLNAAVNAGLADAKLRVRIYELGGTVIGGTPVDFAKMITFETEKWARVIKFAGIKAE
jgi:tripartite-type tricarboxylate transporter receptor subunit TctC